MKHHALRRLAVAAAAAAGIAALTAGTAHADWPSGNTAPNIGRGPVSAWDSPDTGNTYPAFIVGVGRSA
ncbi:hypothetical protein [Streptomyces sp. NRRL WC-3742]|uniref:hypothetical protein n=1 Tax=Streptomyces sp. NRRL WC-3742 TaxID=1463934 RepID=UPI0004C69487|nr:hypothetical protein [Streptomyces sp. NRRL WC-3742]